ncbi:type IV pilin protein [Halanaerobium hydrogeniformans]|uniref:Uncharacterized protein n=1 Tax=Halanaerobium hydrogeniformans TaxID=656519 RepID=E4RLF7_HALHG|nr:type II secretion system protein [Halanaerobium hydrogeniformans]ADQ14871.1 hypothetical protein Halsa_1444 [Halanaerobium hydrogeniformans]
MNIFKNNSDGFTLIELLIVIAVLGILASIAIPRISGMSDQAKDTNISVIAGSIRTAMEVYYQNNESYPAQTDINNNWDNLDDALDILELNSQADYNISAFDYSVNGSDSYEIKLTSDSTGKTYLLSNTGFGEETSE